MTAPVRQAPPRVLMWYSAVSRAKAVASCRYRIGNPAEVGERVRVVIAESLPRGALETVDALVVLRPYPTRATLHALADAGRRGVRCIADYDDLLFAGDAAGRPEVTSGRLSLRWMAAAHRAYAALLPVFDAFSVSTEELAEELRAARPGAPVYVVPNGLSPTWVEQGRLLYPRWTPGEPRVMRFFPGSPTHDGSFGSIRRALATFLHDHDDVSLEIVGNLAWDRSGLPRERARQRAAVPYDALPGLLASSWVNLWPRTETRFDRCKSPIKFLEAAAFGCPTVASTACRRPELDCAGLAYASSDQDWIAALARWLDHDERMSASASCEAVVRTHGAARSWRALARVVGGHA